MTALIVLNGHPDKVILDYIAEDTQVYCADGGANVLYNLGIVPKIIMGDMDSIQPHVKAYYQEQGCEFITVPSEKDETDGQLIIERAIADNHQKIFLFCALGGRMDHTLGNMQILYGACKKGVTAGVISDDTIIYCVNDRMTLNKEECNLVSIIPYEDNTVLTLTGFRYNVEKFKFEKELPIGLSNYLVEKHGNIVVHSGCAMVIITADK